MKDIEEMIADARVEEEMARTRAEERKPSAKVTIDLDEYVELRSYADELSRINAAIVRGLKLGYSKDKLTLDEGDVLTTFKVLYPNAYDTILKEELSKIPEGGV